MNIWPDKLQGLEGGELVRAAPPVARCSQLPSPCSPQSAACGTNRLPELAAQALTILCLDDNLSAKFSLEPRADGFVVANLPQGTAYISL